MGPFVVFLRLALRNNLNTKIDARTRPKTGRRFAGFFRSLSVLSPSSEEKRNFRTPPGFTAFWETRFGTPSSDALTSRPELRRSLCCRHFVGVQSPALVRGMPARV